MEDVLRERDFVQQYAERFVHVFFLVWMFILRLQKHPSIDGASEASFPPYLPPVVLDLYASPAVFVSFRSFGDLHLQAISLPALLSCKIRISPAVPCCLFSRTG